MVALRKVNDSPTGQDEPFDLTKRPLYRISRALLGPVLNRTGCRCRRWGLVGLLFAAAVTLPALRVVPLEDAAVRQQERVPGGDRHARGNHVAADAGGGDAIGRLPGRGARGGRLSDLRRVGVADGLQRHGAALLPAHRIEPGRHPHQPGAEEAARSAVAHHPAADPRRSDRAGGRGRRAGQAGRGAARGRRCWPRSRRKSTVPTAERTKA
jgi:hypothetical protein